VTTPRKKSLSARQEAGLVEEDFEQQPNDEVVAAGEHFDAEQVEESGSAGLLHTNLNLPYMSEEEQSMEIPATVVGPPGYGSPDPASSAGVLVPLDQHPLRADVLPEGHPAAISEDYAKGYLDLTTVPGEPSTPIAVTPATPEEEDDDAAAESEVDATESAVALAEENGVDLSEVEGTGTDGRITKADVQAYLDENPA
jgi:pyruvate/2-oxoglutarate dehydrogenase complex dihydrolipoamide acyltransferase (E2) component